MSERSEDYFPGEAWIAACEAHDAGACDPLTCPWCQGYDPDPRDFDEYSNESD